MVGILTQPSPQLGEYLAASYVKWAEAAGARVVPIRYQSSLEELDAVFLGISGLLLPGGGASLDPADSQYYRAAAYLLDLAERANAAGNRFTVWGTCLGWELLAVWASGNNYSILSSGFTDEGRMASVQILPGAGEEIMLASSLLRHALEASPSTFYSHEMGINPKAMRDNVALSRAFKILALGHDEKHREFVAIAQGRHRPYYAVQFHPEKVVFEWTTKANISHSDDALLVGRAFAIFFNDQVRQSRPGQFARGEKEAFERSVHAVGKLKYLGDSYFSEVYVF